MAGKYTTDEMGPLLITLLRYVIASAFLQFLVWQQGGFGSRISQASYADKAWFFLLGTFGVVGYHFFCFSSLRCTAVANSAIINAFNSVVTGFLAAVILKKTLAAKNYTASVQRRRSAHAVRDRLLGLLLHFAATLRPKV